MELKNKKTEDLKNQNKKGDKFDNVQKISYNIENKRTTATYKNETNDDKIEIDSSNKINNSEIIISKEIDESSIKITENQYSMLCIFCNSTIYLLVNTILSLNGRNIKCQNKECSKYFFITLCPTCKINHVIPRFVSEGEGIKCEKCKFSYTETLCPVKSCNELFYYKISKNYNNYNSPNGIIISHKNMLSCQKISCYHCFNPIVFYNQPYRYHDAMKVKCPYCSKCFNRIFCPQCFEVNFLSMGLYIMGTRIKCKSCSSEFAKILCPNCLQINPLLKNSFLYGEFECRYASCAKKSSISICIYCRKINYFKYDNKISLIPGQVIECGYEDCGEKYCQVFCPSCQFPNPFPKADFKFGKVYKCKNHTKCGKHFMILVCGNCWNYSMITDEVEGKKYACNKCNATLMNFYCPSCKISIFDANSTYKFGQIIECPSCKINFSFFKCFNCKRLIYSDDKDSILGKAINCEFCKQYSVNIICPNAQCLSKISFAKRESDMEVNEQVSCPNCQKKFIYEPQINEPYKNNLKILEELKSLTINFGIPNIDENFLERKIIKEEKEEKNINNINKNNRIININLCIICESQKKESVFFPCGHRCCCYKCAIYFFEVHERCPKCDRQSKCVIPKIFT